jgi:hypothetical protein
LTLGAHRNAPARAWAAVVLVALAYGWWALSLRPFSGEATVAVVASGVAAILLGSRWPRRERAEGRPGGAGWWVALAAAAASWQLAAYLQSPRDEHPTLSSLANALLETHPARSAAFVVWIVGAILLARR